MNILHQISKYSDKRLKLIVLLTVPLGFAFSHWYGLGFQRNFPLEYAMYPFAYPVGFSKACVFVVLSIIFWTFVTLAAYRFRRKYDNLGEKMRGKKPCAWE